MYISWIIPAYNEARRIERTTREVHAYLSGKSFDFEILILDNNSTDATPAIVEGLQKELPRIRLIRARERGKGGAVRKGMMEAKGEIRLFSDADNSTSPDHFDKMEPLFRQGYDVVISSRDSKDAKGAGRDVKEPWYREVLGKGGNIFIQIFGVWGIWDTQNGFKAFTSKSANQIFPRIRVQGWSFDIEVLAIAKLMRYRIGIIPVIWRFDADSKVNWKTYVEVLANTLLIRWNLILGVYKRDT